MDYFLTALAAAWRLLTTFDPEVYLVVWTSLKISSVAALLAALVGIPLGMGLALTRFRGRGLVLLGLNTALALPTVVVGLFVYAFLSRRGPLGELGLLFTPTGVVVGEFLLALPIAVHYAHAAIREKLGARPIVRGGGSEGAAGQASAGAEEVASPGSGGRRVPARREVEILRFPRGSGEAKRGASAVPDSSGAVRAEPPGAAGGRDGGGR